MNDRDNTIECLKYLRDRAVIADITITEPSDWIVRLCDEVLELLKEQEPRVLSREEIEKWNQLDLWMENKDGEPNLCGDYLMPMTRMSYALWNAIIVDNTKKEPITNGYYYGKTWRCWSARPTDEQREAVPWQD